MKKNIIKIVLIFNAVIILTSCTKQNNSNTKFIKEFYAANWNVENLFDNVDDPNKNDEWFLPSSEINWDEAKLEKKLANLARVIKYMNNGKGPDILGIEEVEHEELLYRLIKDYIKKDKYEIAYSESPDNRGIDNALIFNREVFDFELAEPIYIELDDEKKTRDILYVKLKLRSTGDDINIFVNHWPSRRAGLKETEKYRIKAAETLKKKIESLENIQNKNIILMGDFNDLPSNISISKVLDAKPIDCSKPASEAFTLYNLTYPEFQKGVGTYKYKDHWNMLDQIIISNSLLDGIGVDFLCESFEIIKPEFIVQREGKYSGTALPTFGGRKYLGGYSDHFPIGARFIVNPYSDKSLSDVKTHTCLTNNKF